MKTLKLFTLLTIVALLLSSCGNKKGKTADAAEEAFNLDQYIEVAKAITPNMNDISQYFKALDLIEAKYYPVLTNDPYKAHEYKSGFPLAAANLGVYMVDIIYHAYGDATNAAYLSFAAAQELAKYVGVEAAFATTTFDAFEGLAADRDSITLIYNDLLKQSRNYSTEEEILFVHTAYLIGTYAEKLYLMSSLIQQDLNDEDISQQEEIYMKQSIVLYDDRLKNVDLMLTTMEAQIEHFKSFVLIEQFQELRKLATSIEATEDEILAAPIAELRESEKLKKSFEIVSNIRTLIVTTN